MTEAEPWAGVGRHPTPSRLVKEAAQHAVAHFISRSGLRTRLRLLDLFAGDGRLGGATAAALKNSGYRTETVLVEISDQGSDASTMWPGALCIRANAFEWRSDKYFDLVVCNPPYEKIGTARAEALCMPWSIVRAAGCNLYCLGIIRAIEACRPGGIAVAIAPFGWLSGVMTESFRRSVSALCSEVHVYPESSRSVFPGVHQDIAVQVFMRRREEDHGETKVVFAQKGVPSLILEPRADPAQKECIRVRVGPLVWNRHRNTLTDSFEGTLPVVYGACITSEGRLDLSNPRFQGRRRIPVSSIPPNFVTRAPAVLLRRVMRGGPGAWKVDAGIVKSSEYVVENHVIAVELFTSKISPSRLKGLLADQIYASSDILGSPTISVAAVKGAIARILEAMAWADGEEIEIRARAI